MDGVPGSLQIWLESAVDEAAIDDQGRAMFRDDDLVDKLGLAEAFMALMDIHEAHPSIGLMYLPNENRFQVADVTKAFSTETEVNPDLLSPPCPRIPAKRRLELLKVSYEDIEAAAGRFLSEEQIRALLARRDLIDERCPGREPEPDATG